VGLKNNSNNKGGSQRSNIKFCNKHATNLSQMAESSNNATKQCGINSIPYLSIHKINLYINKILQWNELMYQCEGRVIE